MFISNFSKNLILECFLAKRAFPIVVNGAALWEQNYGLGESTRRCTVRWVHLQSFLCASNT